MKKQLFGIISFAFVAAFMLMTSCTKEEGNIYRLKIHQYTSADKTSLGTDGTTLWSDGDVIYVNGTDNTVPISNAGANCSTEISQDVLLDDRLYCFYAGNSTMAGFDATTKTFTYTMPSIINYDGTKLNAPMVGANDGNDVDFENICTMLKLEFLKIPTSITITSENTAISGAGFTARYNGSSWSVTTPAATDDNKTITISNNNYMPYVYVPLPAGNHKLTITATNVDTKEMTSSVVMVKNTIYPIHFAHPFSVSATKKVYFSPGNLIFNNTENAWSFAENQWGYIGSDNVSSSYVANVIDLFCWGTSGYYSEIINTNLNQWAPRNPFIRYVSSMSGFNSTSDGRDIKKTNYDWGWYNRVVNGGYSNQLWFAMSKSEWEYLLSRENKKGFAQVNGVNGLIILPDDFPNNMNINQTTGYTSNSYTPDTWSELEKAGAVFLPAAGYRSTTATQPAGYCNPTTNSTVSYNSSNDFGRYWTATTDGTPNNEDYIWSVNITSASCNLAKIKYSYKFGNSVRLVRDAQ